LGDEKPNGDGRVKVGYIKKAGHRGKRKKRNLGGSATCNSRTPGKAEEEGMEKKGCSVRRVNRKGAKRETTKNKRVR